MAHTGPCRGPLPVESHFSPIVSLRARARWCAMSQRGCLFPPVTIQNYIATQSRPRARPAVLQAVSQHVAAVSQRCITAPLRYITTQLLPLSHDTMLCIATPLGQALRAPALLPAPRASQPYHGPLMVVLWRRLGRVVAESWPYRGPWLRTHACCVMKQFHCIVTQS